MELGRSWQRLIGLFADRPGRQGIIIGDRYVIRELLGMGSYGLTYLCVDQQTGREVALKESKPSKGRLARAVAEQGSGCVTAFASSSNP